MKATKRLYLTADRSRVVEEGALTAAFLFATEGDEISAADVKKYGLSETSKVEPAKSKAAPKDEPKAEEEPDAKATEEPSGTKAVDGPPENKAQQRGARKSDD